MAKIGTKHLSQPFEDRCLYLRCINDHNEVPNMIGSFENGATDSKVAKDFTKNLSLLFKELQGSNSKF